MQLVDVYGSSVSGLDSSVRLSPGEGVDGAGHASIVVSASNGRPHARAIPLGAICRDFLAQDAISMVLVFLLAGCLAMMPVALTLVCTTLPRQILSPR